MPDFFVDDDGGFANWLQQNPDGYVVNTRKVTNVNYMVLHRASCHTMNSYADMTDNPGGFTGRNYMKISAVRKEELKTWVIVNGRRDGAFSKECTLCKP